MFDCWMIKLTYVQGIVTLGSLLLYFGTAHNSYSISKMLKKYTVERWLSWFKPRRTSQQSCNWKQKFLWRNGYHSYRLCLNYLWVKPIIFFLRFFFFPLQSTNYFIYLYFPTRSYIIYHCELFCCLVLMMQSCNRIITGPLKSSMHLMYYINSCDKS